MLVKLSARLNHIKGNIIIIIIRPIPFTEFQQNRAMHGLLLAILQIFKMTAVRQTGLLFMRAGPVYAWSEDDFKI